MQRQSEIPAHTARHSSGTDQTARHRYCRKGRLGRAAVSRTSWLYPDQNQKCARAGGTGPSPFSSSVMTSWLRRLLSRSLAVASATVDSREPISNRAWARKKPAAALDEDPEERVSLGYALVMPQRPAS